MFSYAFRVQAECRDSSPSRAVETCVVRYDVMAGSPEAAAIAARQLFVAELARRRLTPVSGIMAVQVLPSPREEPTSTLFDGARAFSAG